MNIISCAIDVIMYDSLVPTATDRRTPTDTTTILLYRRPVPIITHIHLPTTYTVTHLDASPSTVGVVREKERVRRAIAVVMIVIVGCRR